MNQEYHISYGGGWTWPLESFDYMDYGSHIQTCPSEVPYRYSRTGPYHTYGCYDDWDERGFERIPIQMPDPKIPMFKRTVYFRRVDQMDSAASRILGIDSWRQDQWHPEGWQYCSPYTGRSSWQRTGTGGIAAGARHPSGGEGSRANTLFFDGHVGPETVESLHQLGVNMTWLGANRNYEMYLFGEKRDR